MGNISNLSRELGCNPKTKKSTWMKQRVHAYFKMIVNKLVLQVEMISKEYKLQCIAYQDNHFSTQTIRIVIQIFFSFADMGPFEIYGLWLPAVQLVVHGSLS